VRAICHQLVRANGQQRFQHASVSKRRRTDPDWDERAHVATSSTQSLPSSGSGGWAKNDSWDSSDSWGSWKKDSWDSSDSWWKKDSWAQHWDSRAWHEHDCRNDLVNTPKSDDGESDAEPHDTGYVQSAVTQLSDDSESDAKPADIEYVQSSVGSESDSESHRALVDLEEFEGVREYKGLKLSRGAKNKLIYQECMSALEKGMPTADELRPQDARTGGCPNWWKDNCLEWWWRQNETWLPPVMQSCSPNVLKVMTILRARLEDRIGDPSQIGEDLYRCPCLGTLTETQARILRKQEIRYHGTKWPAVFSIGWTRALKESCDESLGHTFDSDPGAYVAANRKRQRETAVGYSRFQMICGDGVLWAPYIEVHVDPHRRRVISDNKKAGGQEAYDPEGVVVTAIMLFARRPHQMSGHGCLLPLSWLASIEINPRLASP